MQNSTLSGIATLCVAGPECACLIASWWAQEGGARVHVFDSACSVHQVSMLSLLNSPSIFLKWIRAITWAANITPFYHVGESRVGENSVFFPWPLVHIHLEASKFLRLRLRGHSCPPGPCLNLSLLKRPKNITVRQPLQSPASAPKQGMDCTDMGSTPRLSVELVPFVWTVDCGFQSYLGLKLSEKTVKSPRHLSLSAILKHGFLYLWLFLEILFF